MGRPRAALVAAWLAAALAGSVVAGCSRDTPATAVRDLSWACGPQRCTATFRLVNAGDDDERLLVSVRAYAGLTVAQRKTVGEHRERLELRAGQSRHLDVAMQTNGPANRLRVIVAFDAS